MAGHDISTLNLAELIGAYLLICLVFQIIGDWHREKHPPQPPMKVRGDDGNWHYLREADEPDWDDDYTDIPRAM